MALRCAQRYQGSMIVVVVGVSAACWFIGLALWGFWLSRTQPRPPVALPVVIAAIVVSASFIAACIVLAGTAFNSPRSVPVDPDALAVSSFPDVPASAGRQLRSDRSAVAAWREVRWSGGLLRLDVPQDWVERGNDATRLDIRPADQATFLTVRVSPAPHLTANDFLHAARLQAAGRLATSRITGYSVKTLGRASGVMSFERGKDDTRERVIWTAVVPGSKRMITISLGAATATFEKVEPVLGAIVDSIRIE